MFVETNLFQGTSIEKGQHYNRLVLLFSFIDTVPLCRQKSNLSFTIVNYPLFLDGDVHLAYHKLFTFLGRFVLPVFVIMFVILK